MLKTQETYRSEVEFIDKDHIASMFMANCEMNEVYDETAYYIFIAEQVLGKGDDYFENELIQASLATEKEIQRQIQGVWDWFYSAHQKYNEATKQWEWYDNVSEETKKERIRQREEKIQAIHNNRDNIYQNYLKTYKKIKF